MDKYSYSLKLYRAVKSANIDLNGVTVLAGENGCGKSTLTRTLFYLVDAISHYDEYILEDFISHVRSILQRFDMIRREMSMFSKGADKVTLQKMQQGLLWGDMKNADEVMLLYRDTILYYARTLEEYFENNSSRTRMERILMYIDMDPNRPFDSNLFTSAYMNRVQQYYSEYQDKLQRRDVNVLLEIINEKYEVRLSQENIQFMENDVRIIGSKQVGHLFNIQRAIYVDTPMALYNNVIDNPLWEHFNALVSKKRHSDWTRAEKKMKKEIQELMHGTLNVKDDIFEDELHYIREDNLDIPISQVATGLKSFAYLLRFLENGLLNDSTLLIIDEPEVHLHPQWVVEFARILVLLNRELGVKVLIASHNPDMVAAIQAIARKENCLAHVTYYLAKETEPFAYQYKKLGSEIGEIFKSFNVALERIQYYGTGPTDNQ